MKLFTFLERRRKETGFFPSLKKFFVGSPISNAEAQHQRLSKKKALATFASDPLSSVAYATEEILLVLMLAGTSVLNISIPISLAIVALLFIVVISYRQTIYSYPGGGGAYVVAQENLGKLPGLTAASALLTDYILTVSVSVAAGIAALISAFPVLATNKVSLCLVAIAILTLMNLRGIRESSTIFSIPTYAFIVGILGMLVVGAYKLSVGTFSHVTLPPTLPIQHPLTLFLLLRAFSSGCTALTGVEAVSNGVPDFKPPESRNAAITLLVMAFLSSTMFFGITFLSHYHGIVPTEYETVVSQLARSIFGTSYSYYFIQFTTMGILILAANTSYAGFPRLASILAKDEYLPRQFMMQGDRLVFSNGILLLGILSSLLIVVFNASTHALIPLYAVGVFLSFTLSQFGMVKHWFVERRHVWLYPVINAIGGTLTGIVTIVFTITKFSHGAWIITLIIPIFILGFLRVKRHYVSVGHQLSLVGVDPTAYIQPSVPVKHAVIVIIPLSGIHKGVMEALQYASSISSDVRAMYVELDRSVTSHLQSDWLQWGQDVPLVILKSPYRSVVSLILKYIEEVKEAGQGDIVTVLVPEFVTAKWWQSFLHNQMTFFVRAALLFKKGVVVTSVRYHLE